LKRTPEEVVVRTEALIERTLVQGLPDEEVVARVRAGEVALFEVIMRRHNRRLYRAARAIVGHDEAEDVVQDAYVRAYEHLDQFEGRARFSTWLTRIAAHEALARARRAGRFLELEMNDIEEKISPSPSSSPEKRVADRELASVLEAAIAELPTPYRVVFMLRDVEEMNTAETAECLDIPEETVKTRLHRARALLRRGLTREVGAAVRESFEFGLARCDRLVALVLTRIQADRPPAADSRAQTWR
jgi:RNA polymerase sigma-70 factor (ECF subfamily)